MFRKLGPEATATGERHRKCLELPLIKALVSMLIGHLRECDKSTMEDVELLSALVMVEGRLHEIAKLQNPPKS